MAFLSYFLRSSQPHPAEQSPLHFLPAPILVLLALACLLLAACVAGLTLGLMTLDTTALDIIMRSNDATQANAARVIRPIREQGNLLLVTLLFANTLATELLPLVLEALVPGGFFSLVVSVVSIMLFGEIIPQAVCSRHPLQIGSYMIGFVKCLRTLLYPLAAPIAFMLDTLLGEELATMYNREELKGLIDLHRTNAVLTYDETTILKGALEFSEKRVKQILTPAPKVFRLDIDSILDREILLKILRSGHSRIPLYEHSPNNIVCLLLVKQLILVNPDDNIPIRSLVSKKKRNHKIRVAPALECSGSTFIADLLNEFQKGRSHMAIVYDDLDKPLEERTFLGIASIEDIIEEILQEEIIDETDTFTDNTNTKRVLVRNAEGKLYRTTAHTAQVVLVPGSDAAVLVKEFDVSSLRAPLGEAVSGERLRPDWKKPKAKGQSSSSAARNCSNASLEPLLSSSNAFDLEKGNASSDFSGSEFPEIHSQERTSTGTLADPNQQTLSPRQTSHADIRYALMPGQSVASLFGEDDPILPEDTVMQESKAPNRDLPMQTSGFATHENESGKEGKEKSGKLFVRPLPTDASDERVIQIPERNRPPGAKPTPPRRSRQFPSYGALNDPFELTSRQDSAPEALGNDASASSAAESAKGGEDQSAA